MFGAQMFGGKQINAAATTVMNPHHKHPKKAHITNTQEQTVAAAAADTHRHHAAGTY